MATQSELLTTMLVISQLQDGQRRMVPVQVRGNPMGAGRIGIRSYVKAMDWDEVQAGVGVKAKIDRVLDYEIYN